MLAIMIAMLRSMPAHIRPSMLVRKISVGGVCRFDEASMVRMRAKIPVLISLSIWIFNCIWMTVNPHHAKTHESAQNGFVFLANLQLLEQEQRERGKEEVGQCRKSCAALVQSAVRESETYTLAVKPSCFRQVVSNMTREQLDSKLFLMDCTACRKK